jgi:flavin reductase (DIM6/NTAB) family NADH-FMN oxidoreductase RutF
MRPRPNDRRRTSSTPRLFTLGERAIGATIVTAQGADGPAGFLGLSATHVCADPPSMLVSIDRKTSALAAVLHGHHFAINYLTPIDHEGADFYRPQSIQPSARIRRRL